MNLVKVKFLGIPSIKLNGSDIYLPFAKAEHIIYLLAHDKSITRDKLCIFLWGNMKEESAKKSLRNAVYTIRKKFYDDIIISPKRFLLQIDASCEIISDIDTIKNFDAHNELDENIINDFLNIYDGDFLEEFDNKSTIEFEDWLVFNRNKYKKLYVEKLSEITNILIVKLNYNLAEKCCKKLIEIEEFEEIGYINLMKIYSSQEKYTDAINVYNILEKTLRENLSVSPLVETRKMFDSIFKKHISDKIENKKIDFYGRKEEIEILNNNFIDFVSNKLFNSYIIFGEAGVGKTKLIEKAIDNLDYNLIFIKISCYDVESKFMFKLWDKIFESLSFILKDKDILIPIELINNIKKPFPTLNIGPDSMEYNTNKLSNFSFIENYICDMFSIISKKRKIVFIIDDLQWADKNSLELLCKVIFTNKYKIMLVASCRSGNVETLEKFYLNLCLNEKISKIELNRFSKAETKSFIHMIMPEVTGHSDIIYKESEGNPLFITEMMNSLKQGMDVRNITDKMAILINSRIVNLSSEARKLLIICSIFYEMFDIKMLAKITGISSINLIELTEELLSRNILKEGKYSNDKFGLMFTHQKIREYVYKSVSNSKRIVLHETIAEYYETKLKNNQIDRIYFPNLIYHFSNAENKFKVFKYEIKDMQVIFDVCHEIFPIVKEKMSTGVFEYYTDQKVLEEKFKKLKEIYEELEFKDDKEIYELQIIYLYLYGRFHKDIGDLSKGIEAIRKMIYLSLRIGNHNYCFEGYVQLIQYAINSNKLNLMKHSIENAEKIAGIKNDKDKISLVLRYKGYLNILQGNYKDGEYYLSQAVELFSSLTDKDKYILNISASYFYIGESKRLQKKYSEAIKYYYKAFEQCDEEEDFSSIAVIFSKIGHAKYELGIYDEAQFYLLKSLKAYNKTIFSWGRAEVYYCLALIYDKKGMKEKSKNYIEGAILFSNKYYNNDLNKKAELFLDNIEN